MNAPPLSGEVARNGQAAHTADLWRVNCATGARSAVPSGMRCNEDRHEHHPAKRQHMPAMHLRFKSVCDTAEQSAGIFRQSAGRRWT